MEFKDLFITPIYLLLLTVLAYWIRPYLTNKHTRKYFLPALWVRFIGAIALGMIYQFYYGDGDTFTYFHRGSKHVWDAFLDSPMHGFKLIFGPMDYESEIFNYASKIYTYGDSASYSVVRITALFDLLSFHTYSATALFFALGSFTGSWMIYMVFHEEFPRYSGGLAIAILFVPSVFFWGSGILKDTITMAAIGWLFYGLYYLFRFKGNLLINLLLIVCGAYTLYVIKIYILLCFVPAMAFWIFIQYQSRIRNVVLKLLAAPILIGIGLVSAYFATIFLGQDHYRYSFDEVAYTAEQTARWNYYVSQRDQGSGYTLGDYDFTPAGLARKFVPAVTTSFFRPTFFEVRNPVMLISAIENTIIFFMFLYAVWRIRNWKLLISKPILMMSILFAVFFSFAVGVTTYNLGSLVRYRIPMLPFFISTIYLLSRKYIGFEDRYHSRIKS